MAQVVLQRHCTSFTCSQRSIESIRFDKLLVHRENIIHSSLPAAPPFSTGAPVSMNFMAEWWLEFSKNKVFYILDSDDVSLWSCLWYGGEGFCIRHKVAFKRAESTWGLLGRGADVRCAQYKWAYFSWDCYHHALVCTFPSYIPSRCALCIGIYGEIVIEKRDSGTLTNLIN